eukprot:2684746-Pleurochrysis_carterae.AAC.1
MTKNKELRFACEVAGRGSPPVAAAAACPAATVDLAACMLFDFFGGGLRRARHHALPENTHIQKRIERRREAFRQPET